MVQVDVHLLLPLLMLMTIFFIVIFSLLKEFSIDSRNWFLLGMLFGSLVYSMLVLGSTIMESSTVSEFWLKYVAIGFAATYYVAILLFSAVISLMILVKKESNFMMLIFKSKVKRIIYIITGMALIFAISNVYFALVCVETIPFIENFVSANSTCSI